MTNILQEADEITEGKRNVDYGHPFINHGQTADMWTAFLKAKLKSGASFTPAEVCWMNILQKISRETNKPKRDNKVDIAGFARNVEMIEEYERDNPDFTNRPRVEISGLPSGTIGDLSET